MNKFFLTTPFVPLQIRNFLFNCLVQRIDFDHSSMDELQKDDLVQLCLMLQDDFRNHPYILPTERERILNYLTSEECLQLQQIEQEIQIIFN
jgi:hypothetical protein